MKLAHTVPERPQDVRSLPVTDGRLMQFVEDPIDCMRRLQAAHGRLAVLREDGQQIAFVFGPEGNQRILSDNRTFHARFFSLRGPRKSAQRRLTSGLMSMNGPTLKEHRRMVMGPFQKASITRYHRRICQLADDMLARWMPGETLDLHEEMTRYMLQVTSAILFGLQMPEFACHLGRMIDRWVELNHQAGMGAFVSDPALAAKYEELLAFAEKLEVDIRTMIRIRREALRGGSASPGDSNDDVLSLLIQAHREQGRLSESELIGHVALLFGAAHMTTAHTFTWTLFLLSQHPRVARAVLDEIDETLTGEFPTLDEIARMPLTERAIKESMRILPASSYSQRINAVPVSLGPLELPRGTPIIFSQFITHHLPDLYPEPDSFRPDRWRELSPSPYAYLPFGAGPRMCLGGPLAMMILKTILPAILKRYRLTVVANSTIDARVVSTMLGPTTPVPMQVDRQDGRFRAEPVAGTIHRLVELPGRAADEDGPRRRAA